MKRAVRDPDLLCQMLGLPPETLAGAIAGSREFSVFAPHEYIARMRPADPNDPLLLQVLPSRSEGDEAVHASADPVGDRFARRQPGLLQKYHGRVLMVTTGACAVHCRYCFRRHYPYSDEPHSVRQWQPALDFIADDATIDEVILSGGDPLTLPDAVLAELIERLEEIGHVRRLRIHTRLPIVIPQRVTDDIVHLLQRSRLTPLMVLHANHANEIDAVVAASIDRLANAGIPLLNQTVLLRGINDDPSAMERLCRELVDLRVMPYYLHQLDRVAGATHFEVPVSRGREIIQHLRSRLPGYAVPRYVREIPGETSKRLIE